MPLVKDGTPWLNAAWSILKWSTIGGLGLGFAVGTLSHLSGNTISANGLVFEGWYGVWLITLACGAGGFLFGLCWMLVFRAIGEAARH